jgi:hypothetical protein
VLRHGLDSLLAAVPLLSKLSLNLPEQDLAPPAAGSSGDCYGQHAVVAFSNAMAYTERTLANSQGTNTVPSHPVRPRPVARLSGPISRFRGAWFRVTHIKLVEELSAVTGTKISYAGREQLRSSDAAPVRKHAAADSGFAAVGRIGAAARRNQSGRRRGVEGGVSEKSL